MAVAVLFLVALLAIPPSAEPSKCDDPTALILLSPSYRDGESNQNGVPRCPSGARRQAAVAVVPVVAVAALLTVDRRRRRRKA